MCGKLGMSKWWEAGMSRWDGRLGMSRWWEAGMSR